MSDSEDLPGYSHSLHLRRRGRQEAGCHVIAEVGIAKSGAGRAGRAIGYKAPRASSLFHCTRPPIRRRTRAGAGLGRARSAVPPTPVAELALASPITESWNQLMEWPKRIE